MKRVKKGSIALGALSLILSLLLIFPTGGAAFAKEADKGEQMLIPGGMCFGAQLNTDGALVVGFSGIHGVYPARDAGLQCKDLIVSVDKKKVTGSDSLITLVNESGGKSVCVEVTRNGTSKSFDMTPQKGEDGKYRIGVYVRDSAAGIGTVTFIDPETNAFGGLGHGIYDPESEALIPMSKGIVSSVRVRGVRRGKIGIPGEIKGVLEPHRIGKLTANTELGVFGYFTGMPISKEAAIPVAKADRVKEGRAQIICTTECGKDVYDIEIKEIHPGRDQKNLVIKITDEHLIDLTGGIVQGMSGSPIIQKRQAGWRRDSRHRQRPHKRIRHFH